jgi:phosphoenolpyruvate synthase/pyruvate phosphate dikinase
MAKVRTMFRREVDDLLPLLHETYRLIGRFQKERVEAHAGPLRQQLDVAGERLQFFKPYMQGPKQAFFDALLEPELSLSDRIVALDTAVGMMHIEFDVERAYAHRESVALRRVLERCRMADDEVPAEASTAEPRLLARGLGASPGRVSGKAVVLRRRVDDRRLPDDCIVVAPMTRPELVAGSDKIRGIVTDRGGSLCHAAVVARERGIPCVVGTGGATRAVRDRMLVIVDGTTGQVLRAR